MGEFEKFLENQKQKQGNFYGSLREKSTEAYESGATKYSFEEFDEMLEMRDDETLLAEQKAYYFMDKNIMEAKQVRYKKLSEDENKTLDQFSETHKNRSARKRKNNAAAAAKKFAAARVLEDKVRLNDLSPEEQFAQESKIMKLHLEGRIEAAKMKSTSDENEEYRIAKARYSCASVMRNQLKALLEKDPTNAKLLAAQEKVNKNYEKAKKNFAKKAPSLQKKWEEEQGLNNEEALQNQLTELQNTKNKDFTLEDVKLLNLYQKVSQQDMDEVTKKTRWGKGPYAPDKTYGEDDRIMRSMFYGVRKDKNGKPMSALDEKKEQFNQKWFELCNEDSKERLEAAKQSGASEDEINALQDEVERNAYARENMILERLQSFENFKMPPADVFDDDKALTYYLERPMQVWENYHTAIAIDNLQKKEPFLDKYMTEHPRLDAKIRAWSVYVDALKKILGEKHFVVDDMRSINKNSEKEDVDLTFDKSTYKAHIANYEGLKAIDQRQKEKDKKERAERAEYFAIKDETKEVLQKIQSTRSLEDLQKDNPNITEEGYAIYLKARNKRLFVHDPEFVHMQFKAKENKAAVDKFGTQLTLTRCFAPLLKNFEYNDKLKPATEQAKENYEWNKKWTRAIMDDDVTTQEEMLSQEFPKLFDNLTFDFPDPANLETWAEDILKNKFSEFKEVAARNHGISDLKKGSTWTKNFLASHPDFDAKVELIGVMTNFLEYYTEHKYGVITDGGIEKSGTVSVNAAAAQGFSADAMKDVYAQAYRPAKSAGYLG